MHGNIEIIPDRPFEEGIEAGRALGDAGVTREINELLADELLADTLGAMSRQSLEAYVVARRDAEPDYGRYPELQDIYPERLDYLRGFAQGAGCSYDDASVLSYLRYRKEIDGWHASVQLPALAPETIERDPRRKSNGQAKGEPVAARGPKHVGCSGIAMVGPDGVIGAHQMDSGPPARPASYQYQAPGPYSGLEQLAAQSPDLKVRKPRTGYITGWGVGNEKGVACLAGTSCSTLLDDPIEDTWPIGPFPLLRFAANLEQLLEMYQRYTLFNWGRASQIWVDTAGNAAAVEKSFRRIGVRRMASGAQAVWCTEGYWDSDEMHAFQRRKRLEFLEKSGRHAGAGDMQYATDSAVRFCHLGELCHEDWGHGYEHVRRILCDHAPFPRGICRHGGPDTDAYDQTVTMGSVMYDVTHNRVFDRRWEPWKRFCCVVPEQVTQYPPRPSMG